MMLYLLSLLIVLCLLSFLLGRSRYKDSRAHIIVDWASILGITIVCLDVVKGWIL